MRRIGLILYGGLFILAISLPYFFAAVSGNDSFVFGGFLLNPIDGNSYLAKMEIGRQSNWLFHLPYTAETADGAYIFLFYILLGHVSLWTGIAPIIVFHIARVLAAIVMVVALYGFIYHVLGNYNLSVRNGALWLVSFGSGLGWIAAFFGGFSSDFWVAEAYPFLSAYTNPHFPLGLAILLNYFLIVSDPDTKIQPIWIAFQGLLLAIVMPFGIVVAGLVAGIHLIVYWMIERRFIWKPFFWFFLFGGFFLIYQYMAIQADPLLHIWNRQNVTLSPPAWDFVLSFSPGLILAGYAVMDLLKKKKMKSLLVPVIWLISGLVLVYFPFSLQRRFLLGYFIPVCILGVVGLWLLVKEMLNRFRRIIPLLIVVSIITNGLIIAGGLNASIQKDPAVFMHTSELDAFKWIYSRKDPGNLVLASERSGLLIPAYTNWRVLYGHPFETVNAEQRLSEINRLFQGDFLYQDFDEILKEKEIDFVFLGPFDTKLERSQVLTDFSLVYENKKVKIYSVKDIQ
jgi:hypothetical protein